MSLTEQILSPRSDNTLVGLRQADKFWSAIKENKIEPSQVVFASGEKLLESDSDIVICGGTLGILLGAALQRLGWQVTLIEKGILKGREQEWNISRQELEVFIDLELLTKSELERAITTEYNPARVSFLGGKEVWVKDVLNIGVDPVYLLATLKQKFLQAGGNLLEKTAFETATVHPDGVEIGAGEQKLEPVC